MHMTVAVSCICALLTPLQSFITMDNFSYTNRTIALMNAGLVSLLLYVSPLRTLIS